MVASLRPIPPHRTTHHAPHHTTHRTTPRTTPHTEPHHTPNRTAHRTANRAHGTTNIQWPHFSSCPAGGSCEFDTCGHLTPSASVRPIYLASPLPAASPTTAAFFFSSLSSLLDFRRPFCVLDISFMVPEFCIMAGCLLAYLVPLGDPAPG